MMNLIILKMLTFYKAITRPKSKFKISKSKNDLKIR